MPFNKRTRARKMAGLYASWARCLHRSPDRMAMINDSWAKVVFFRPVRTFFFVLCSGCLFVSEWSEAVSQRNLFNYNRVTKAWAAKEATSCRPPVRQTFVLTNFIQINAPNPAPVPSAASFPRHYNYEHTSAPETFFYTYFGSHTRTPRSSLFMFNSRVRVRSRTNMTRKLARCMHGCDVCRVLCVARGTCLSSLTGWRTGELCHMQPE